MRHADLNRLAIPVIGAVFKRQQWVAAQRAFHQSSELQRRHLQQTDRLL